MVRSEDRKLFAKILMWDPEARKTFLQLRKMGATRISLDRIFIRQPDGTYTVSADPGAWNAILPGYGAVCAIRRDDGWSIHG